MILVASALAGCARAPASDGLTIRAAASLGDLLPAIADAWVAHGHARPTIAVDATSRVARQITAGAPTDLFIAADEEWMDELARTRSLVEDTRRDLWGNTLVLVTPRRVHAPPRSPSEIADRVQRLALAAESVPAGKYARAALEKSGVMATLAPRLVTADNVRTALAWAARGEVDAAIVYATDARAEPRVELAFTFDQASHAPIVYPATVIAGSRHVDEARAFLAFCGGAEGRALAEAAGFRALPSP